jgi:hypothetical protein
MKDVFWRKLAAAHKGMIRHAKVAWRKGNVIRKNWTWDMAP